jgi:amino acid transporter
MIGVSEMANSSSGAVAGKQGANNLDVTTRGDVDLLHSKAVGLIGVLFLTVTGAAPITAMLLNTPIVVGNGNGVGAPAAFLVATVILLIFSVGYAAMARKVTSVGGFYSFISLGLGRELGMGMGFASVVAYAVFEPSLAGGFAYFANLKLHQFGIDVAWPWLALAMVLLIFVLTYLDVKISTAVLGVALIAEVAMLLIFDVGVFSKSGNGATVTGAAINPLNAFLGYPGNPSAKLAAGAAGIGLFFAFWSWVGFESAPNYAEESRNPKRIVPLSLYISVLFLGILYTITSWAAISGYSTTDASVGAAQGNAAEYFFTTSTKLIGPWSTAIMSYLILTGSFACGMAFHNTASRYLYALGRERILPKALGRTHKRFKTPHIASLVQTSASIIIVLLFAIFGGTKDPTTQAYGELYGLMALLGTIIILFAQAIVSVAIVVYFKRQHPDDHHWWQTMLAPVLAFLSQAYVLYLCLTNMGFLGGGFSFAAWIPWIDGGVIVLGILGALYLKSHDPARYDQIGRMIYEGFPEGADGPLHAAEASARR